MANNLNGPHKAIVRIVTEIFAMNGDGELHPVPSSVDCVILKPMYGKNFQECLTIAKEEVSKCQKKIES